MDLNAVKPPMSETGNEVTALEPDEEKAEESRGLGTWVQRLSERGMPIFARTAQDIGKVTSNIDSTASELSRVVLQDAAMTARLLRIANSPLFNVTGRTISTVSRAVVLLGFDEVRSICLSIAVVESMLKGPQKDRVLDEMARSFHAAVQARSFSEKRGDQAPEEVFIATLLYQLGDMAFWTFSGPMGRELDAALAKPGVDPVKVQQEVLGFSLTELTLGLSREWKLGELLQHALEGKQDTHPRCGNVIMGHELAIAAEKGWDHPDIKPMLERIAERLYLPVKDLTAMVHTNAEEAIKTATQYGAGRAGCRIPQPVKKGKPQATEEVEVVAERKTFLDPDPHLQLQILRELSQLMESKPDLNMLLEMVLEGIYRGIGMDRTLFAMRTPDQRFLKARYALGHDTELMRRKFHFELSPLKANIFTQVLDSRAAVWVRNPVDVKLKRLLTPGVQSITEDSPFFAMPIEIMGKVIGLFYADRNPSGRELDEESYTSFRHFGQQANMALTFLSGRR
jgi:HD-like signal output (HDOD) protein